MNYDFDQFQREQDFASFEKHGRISAECYLGDHDLCSGVKCNCYCHADDPTIFEDTLFPDLKVVRNKNNKLIKIKK